MTAIWAVLFLILILVNVTVAVVCGTEDDPFMHIDATWRATKGELNLIGRIICVTLVTIVTLPAIAFDFLIKGILFLISVICGIFWWIFRDRSKDD